MVLTVQELKSGAVPLLIPTPNAKNEIGYNRDRFLFNPSLTSEEYLKQFKFLGILLGVAIRTKKPLDLYLAPVIWKQLAGMTLNSDDLEEVYITRHIYFLFIFIFILFFKNLCFNGLMALIHKISFFLCFTVLIQSLYNLVYVLSAVC